MIDKSLAFSRLPLLILAGFSFAFIEEGMKWKVVERASSRFMKTVTDLLDERAIRLRISGAATLAGLAFGTLEALAYGLAAIQAKPLARFTLFTFAERTLFSIPLHAVWAMISGKRIASFYLGRQKGIDFLPSALIHGVFDATIFVVGREVYHVDALSVDANQKTTEILVVQTVWTLVFLVGSAVVLRLT